MTPAHRLQWLRGFLELIESGDAIVGATPASLALRGQLRMEILQLEATL